MMLHSALLSDAGHDDTAPCQYTPPPLWENKYEYSVEVEIGKNSVVIESSRDIRPLIADAIAALNRLSRLQQNWDSYGGAKVDQRCLEQAFKVYLEATLNLDSPRSPHFAATPDGGVGISWENGSKGLEVEVSGANTVKSYFFDDDAGTEEIDDVGMDMGIVIRRLDEVFA